MSNITISAHNLGLTPALQEYTDHKIRKVVDKFPDIVSDTKIILTVDKKVHDPKVKQNHRQHTAQATLQTRGKTTHVEHTGSNLYAAIDALCGKVERQVSQIKTRQSSAPKRHGRQQRKHLRNEHPMA